MERYGGGEAYQPLLDALTRLCRRSGREQSIAILRKFAPAWLAQLPALQAPASSARCSDGRRASHRRACCAS